VQEILPRGTRGTNGPYLAGGPALCVCNGGDALLLGKEEEQLREDGQEDDEGQLGEEGLQDGAHGSTGKGKKRAQSGAGKNGHRPFVEITWLKMLLVK
jgi:hypothetical protein